MEIAQRGLGAASHCQGVVLLRAGHQDLPGMQCSGERTPVPRFNHCNPNLLVFTYLKEVQWGG